MCQCGPGLYQGSVRVWRRQWWDHQQSGDIIHTCRVHNCRDITVFSAQLTYSFNEDKNLHLIWKVGATNSSLVFRCLYLVSWIQVRTSSISPKSREPYSGWSPWQPVISWYVLSTCWRWEGLRAPIMLIDGLLMLQKHKQFYMNWRMNQRALWLQFWGRKSLR